MDLPDLGVQRVPGQLRLVKPCLRMQTNRRRREEVRCGLFETQEKDELGEHSWLMGGR